MAPSGPPGTVLEARGLPTGSAIRCHSSTSCAGAYDSGFVGPRLHDVATGGVGDSFVLLPRILRGWGSFARAFLPGRLVFIPNSRCSRRVFAPWTRRESPMVYNRERQPYNQLRLRMTLLGWPIHVCLTATACFQHFCSDPSSSQYSGDPLNSFPWRASPGEQYAYRRSASEGSSSSPPWKEKERLHEAECHRAVLWS